MGSSDTGQLEIRSFAWERDAELVKKFYEEIVVVSFPPRNMSEETCRRKLRLSEKNGLFIWEIKGDVVGWSWLKIRENEFFKEGCYGENKRDLRDQRMAEKRSWRKDNEARS